MHVCSADRQEGGGIDGSGELEPVPGEPAHDARERAAAAEGAAAGPVEQGPPRRAQAQAAARRRGAGGDVPGRPFRRFRRRPPSCRQ